MTQSLLTRHAHAPAPLHRAADLQPSLPALSKRRLECLKMIFKFFVKHGNFPTTMEVARIMGLKARQSALQNIKGLITEECLVRDAIRKSRYIRFTDIGLAVLFSNGINVTESIAQKTIITRSDF
ncbi:MAG: hypothetical protein ACYC9J_07015 [Sulfuricaulis sp.]